MFADSGILKAVERWVMTRKLTAGYGQRWITLLRFERRRPKFIFD
jgi:hypothetical protein